MGKSRNQQPLLLRADIDLSADGKAPTEFRLLRYGVNESDYGPIVFDEIAAAMVMKDFAEKGIPRLFSDWNHGMIPEDEDDKPSREEAASCASFVPAVRNGELWATDVLWTEDGRGDVESRRYNLYSPAFAWEVGGDGQLRPRCLINFALVNRAGLDDIQPLIAATAADIREKERSMNEFEKLYNETKAALETARERIRALEAGASEVILLSSAVGLRADAASAERMTAVQGLVSFRGDVLKLTGQANIDAAIGLIGQWKDKAGNHDQLLKLTAQREDELLAKELDDTIKKYVDAVKILPADAPIERENALARGAGKASKAGIAYLTARFETAQPRLSTTEIAQRQGGGPLPAKGEAKMDRVMGIDPVAFAAWQQKQAARAE